MSSRLKQTTIDVGNFAALMSPRPAGGRGSVAPASAAPSGRHAGTLAGRQKRKKPIRQDGLFTCLMPGSLWRASCPPPSGPLLRNVQIRSRRICPTLESAHRQTTDKTKSPVERPGFLFLRLKRTPSRKVRGFLLCGVCPPVALRLPGLLIRHGATPRSPGQGGAAPPLGKKTPEYLLLLR